MNAPPMTIARWAILAQRRGEASAHQVLRSLMEHREWWVPLGFFPASDTARMRKTSFGRLHHVPPSELWVFTEAGTACEAHQRGAPVGSFVQSIPGHQLFATLRRRPGIRAVQVNAGGYPEDLLTFAPDAFETLEQWALAIGFERLLGSSTELSDAVLARSKSYEQYLAFMLPDERMLVKAGHDGLAQPGVVCTSQDSADILLETLEDDFRETLRLTTLSAAELRHELERQDIDGLVLNPLGPGPQRTLSMIDSQALCEGARP